MKAKYQKNTRNGSALLVVLFIIMVITVLSLGFLTQSDVELACGENMILRSQMDYLAESGLEHARGLILNPQDISSEYWPGATGLQLTAGSNDYYDIDVIRDDSEPNDLCNYILDCNSYRLKNGETVGFSGVRATLRLDPCIAFWSGADTVFSNGTTINGDVFCNGILTNAGVIYGDVFAGTYVESGSKTGQYKSSSDLSLSWPRVTTTDFISYYNTEYIISGSISGQSSGSLDPVRICYSNNDLEIAGNNQINGMLLVNGDLVVRNNQNTITAAKNLPSLLVTGDLRIEAGSELQINGLGIVDGNMYVSTDSADIDILGGLFIQGTLFETTSDSSGNSHNGQLYGGPNLLPTTGKYNGAVSFDGIDDKIENGDSIPASINNLSAVTLSLWIKSNVTYQDRGILFTTEPTNNDVEFGLRYDAKGGAGGGISGIKASIQTTSGSAQIESSSYVQTTSWQHLALSWQNDPNDSHLKLYINGTLDSGLRYDSGPVYGAITGVQKLMLGCGTKNKYWNGLIDDVQIYSRALNMTEINTVKNGGTVSDLLLHWNLDENGSNITITAAPSKTAVNLWSEEGNEEKWSQAAGAFYRSIDRK